MKKRIILFVVALIAMAFTQSAWAYDFSSVSPSGHTLYYQINGDAVTLVEGDVQPTGNVVIPESVTYMGVTFPVTSIDHAFYYCQGLTSVVIPNGVTTITNYAFGYCSSLTSVTIPSSVTNINNLAFYDCTGLTSIVIPSSVTYIGYYAFGACTGLTSVTIEGLTNVDGSSFSGCNNIAYLYYNSNDSDIPLGIPHNSLQTVVIGNNVTSIPDNAFTNTTALAKVTIGSGVTTIGENAFRFCSNLDSIFALPSTAPTLGANAFQATPDDKVVLTTCGADYAPVWGSDGFVYTTMNAFTLTLSSNNPSWGSASFVHSVDCQQTATVQAVANAGYQFDRWNDGNTDNPRTITLTQNTALQAVFSIVSYNITGVANPTEGGFVAVSGDTYQGATATLTAVANTGYHFVQWSDGGENPERSVLVNGDATYIALFALNAAPAPTPEEDVLTYLDDSRTVVTGIRADLRDRIITVRIPTSVHRIANRAFMGATAMEHITIPSTVDTVGDSAFYLCNRLVSVTLPNSVRYLGKYAFYGCTSLEAASMPATLDTLRERTFAECSALFRLELPSTLKEIGAYALYHCENIYQLTIPASVDTIRENAFAVMSNLNLVTIVGGNHHFANDVFRYGLYSPLYNGSIRLTNFRGDLSQWMTNSFGNGYSVPMYQSGNFAINGEVIFDLIVPTGTQMVNSGAFYNDDKLMSITIPATVDTIGAYAFAELGKLKTITLLGIPRVDEHAFDNVNNDVIVMVPCDELETVRANGWSHFTRFYASGVPVIDFRHTMGGIVRVLQEPTCSNLTARFEAVPGENYTFLAWSDGNTDNPRTMTVTQDEVISALWQRNPNPSPILSKNYSFDTELDAASWDNYSNGHDKWYVGTGHDIAAYNGNKYLFLSKDAYANEYSDNTDATGFNEMYLRAGTYNIRYHWIAGGENNYDMMNVYLLPDENNFNFAGDGAIIVSSQVLNHGDSWTYNSEFVEVPANGWYKLAYRWTSDGSVIGNPAPAVDNIYVLYQDEDYLENLPVVLTVRSDNESMGTTSGGGLYYFNDMVEISATPLDGYQFEYWSDGNTNAVRTVRAGDYAGANNALVAYFGTRQFAVTTHVSPAGTASTEGDGYYYTDDEVTLRVVEPQAGWAFMGWSINGTDVDYTNDPYVFNITSDVELTAIMQQMRDTIWVVRVVNAPGDTTTTYYTSNPRSSFAPAPSGMMPYNGGNIEIIEVMDAKIYSAMGQIVVEDAGGEMVTVYDVNGRILSRKQDTTGKLYFDVPITGTYMVKIGELITRKVVVMR